MRQAHAVVTGGSSGIGAAVVDELLTRGMCVSVLDLESGSVPGVRYEQVDLTHEEGVIRALTTVAAQHGPVTHLVTAAGIRGEFVPSLDLDIAHVRRVLEVNVLGTLIPARETVRKLPGRGGSIVMISSTTAYGGWENQADYGTSKAAIRSLVEHLAVEWAPLGVRVNAVAPGHTLTPMVEELVNEGYDLAPVRERTPLRKLARPEQIAQEVAHLLLDSTHVTGQCLAVDGGWTVVGK